VKDETAPARVFRFAWVNGRPKLTARVGTRVVMMSGGEFGPVRLDLFGDPAEGRVTVSRGSRPDLHALALDSLADLRPERFLAALAERGEPHERATALAAARVVAEAKAGG
jgi:hypothetical protein